MPMLGLALVVMAIAGSIMIRAINSIARGREFKIDAEDLAWYLIALALVTNLFNLIPSNLYSIGTALITVDKLLNAYNNLVNSLGIADAVLSLSINIGLPIAEAAIYVATGSGLGSIMLVIEVIEHLTNLVINYVVHVISILVVVLWFMKYAVIIGEVLGRFIPYMAFFLVIPRVRNAVIIPTVLYLVLGIALPLGINTMHSLPIISTISETQIAPSELGFINIEVLDELGRSVPTALCINGYGFPYSEVVGLPNGAGVVALPMYIMRNQPIPYRINCLIALFMKFSTNYFVVPGLGLNNDTVVIRLPMIAVLNDDSLVALFNYTWSGVGNTIIGVNSGYAVINVTTPCNGNLTVMAYASGVALRLINSTESNCSITYSIIQGVPINMVSQFWINNVITNHELFCQDLEQVLNPSIVHQGITAPPQVINAILGMVNESCNGPGNYTVVINELRSDRLTASLKCHGTCGNVSISALVIGVKPYEFNYYALWSGSYITWFNDSLMIIRNAYLNPLNLGILINLFIGITYYSALLLGIIGLVAIIPRIRYWSRIMSVVRIKLGIKYEDIIAVTSPLISMVVRSRRVNNEGITRRYAHLRWVYEIARHSHTSHLLRVGYWVVRDLPKVSAAPHVLLPTLYGVSLARDYLVRRALLIERETLRNALRAVVSVALSPNLVLRPYSLLNPMLRYGINELTRYMIIKTSTASRVYGALKSYLRPSIALYIALRSVTKGIDESVINAVSEVWQSMDKPLDTLRTISTRLGILRVIDRDLTTLIVSEALRELLVRHGSLVDARVLINNAVVKLEDVAKVDDYADVVIRVNNGDVTVKAWIVKEFLRIINSIRDLGH